MHSKAFCQSSLSEQIPMGDSCERTYLSKANVCDHINKDGKLLGVHHDIDEGYNHFRHFAIFAAPIAGVGVPHRL